MPNSEKGTSWELAFSWTMHVASKRMTAKSQAKVASATLLESTRGRFEPEEAPGVVKIKRMGMDMATASRMEIAAEVDIFKRIFKAWI
jgi:hypothetical protein